MFNRIVGAILIVATLSMSGCAAIQCVTNGSNAYGLTTALSIIGGTVGIIVIIVVAGWIWLTSLKRWD